MNQLDKNFIVMAEVAKVILAAANKDNESKTVGDKISACTVQDFAALILKIKYSILWDRCPITMSYLNGNDSLEFYFSNYSRVISISDVLKMDASKRILSFLEFLSSTPFHNKKINVDILCCKIKHESNLYNSASDLSYKNNKFVFQVTENNFNSIFIDLNDNVFMDCFAFDPEDKDYLDLSRCIGSHSYFYINRAAIKFNSFLSGEIYRVIKEIKNKTVENVILHSNTLKVNIANTISEINFLSKVGVVKVYKSWR